MEYELFEFLVLFVVVITIVFFAAASMCKGVGRHLMSYEHSQLFEEQARKARKDSIKDFPEKTTRIAAKLITDKQPTKTKKAVKKYLDTELFNQPDTEQDSISKTLGDLEKKSKQSTKKIRKVLSEKLNENEVNGIIKKIEKQSKKSAKKDVAAYFDAHDKLGESTKKLYEPVPTVGELLSVSELPKPKRTYTKKPKTPTKTVKKAKTSPKAK